MHRRHRGRHGEWWLLFPSRPLTWKMSEVINENKRRT
jgi:hypothetical protein